MSAMDTKPSAHIKLIEIDRRPVLDVALPRGTTFAASSKVFARVDELIVKLTGCPCNSGVPIWIRDGGVRGQIPNINEEVQL